MCIYLVCRIERYLQFNTPPAVDFTSQNYWRRYEFTKIYVYLFSVQDREISSAEYSPSRRLYLSKLLTQIWIYKDLCVFI